MSRYFNMKINLYVSIKSNLYLKKNTNWVQLFVFEFFFPFSFKFRGWIGFQKERSKTEKKQYSSLNLCEQICAKSLMKNAFKFIENANREEDRDRDMNSIAIDFYWIIVKANTLTDTHTHSRSLDCSMHRF